MNTENKYDIIVLAGQSNAEGNGVGKTTEELFLDDVYEVVDENPCYIYDEPEKSVWGLLKISVPTVSKLQNFSIRKNAEGIDCQSFSTFFANEYIKAGLLEKDRKILIVKTACGGAGFAKKQWGIGNPLHERMISLIDSALSYGKDSRIVAFLWHQGEHDAYENASFTDKERYDFYYDNFLSTCKFVRDRYNKFSFPIIAGEFVNDWASKYQRQCDVVENATKDVLKTLGYSDFVSSEGLKSNDQDIKNGDDIHFSALSCIELGKRYFEKYKNLVRSK